MVTISYAILVNDEYEEIKQLVGFLMKNWQPAHDEIIIVQDYKMPEIEQTENYKLVTQYLQELTRYTKFSFFLHPLNSNFAEQKNYLNSKCTNDYIFNIDADEMPTENLMKNLHAIIEMNSTSDVFILPRINKVKNITGTHIAKWGWRIDEEGKVNWPDWQYRIYKNNDIIKWERPVHEFLVGYKTFTPFPKDVDFALKHFKNIDKQEKQNNHYTEIIKEKIKKKEM